jgi:potassium efflux system protein
VRLPEHSRCCIALILWLIGAAAWAAPPAAQPGGSLSLSRSVVETRMAEVKASSDYSEQTKTTLSDLYHKVLSNLEAAEANSATAKTFTQARESAPAEAKQVRAALEKAEAENQPVTVEVSEKTPLADVEQLLLKEKADQAAVDAKLTNLEEQLDQENARPEQTRQRLSQARQQLDELNVMLKQAPAADEPAVLSEARRWNQQAQIKALNAEVTMLDQELLSQPMRVDLLKARRDTTARNLKRIGERIKLLEDALNQKRRSQVEAARAEVESAQGETLGKPPVVQKFAAENAALSDQLTRLTSQLEQVSSGGQITTDRAKLIEDEFRGTQQKLAVAGLSQALGQILVEQRRLLPDVREIRKAARIRETQIAETALNQIQRNEQLRKLQNLDAYVNELIAGLSSEEAAAVRVDLLEFARTRRNLLEKLVATGESYLRALGELDYAQTRLLETVTAYDDFLAERLLWVRSAPGPSLDLLLNTPAQVIELLSPKRWLGAAHTLLDQLLGSPLPIAVLLVAAVLLAKKRAMREALRDTGKQIIKVRSDKFRYSVEALAWTILLVVPWPLLLWTTGWMLANSLDASQFDRALARGLIILSPAFFYLSAFRSLCRPGGLATAHFHWPESSAHALRRQIGMLMVVFLPAALIAVVTARNTTSVEGALARIAFVVAISALSWFFYRLFGPNDPVLAAEFKRFPHSPLVRYRYLWLVLALAVPVLLTVLAISGFLYTAGTLTSSLIDTLWLVLGALVFHQMALRWLLMIQRKLAFDAAVERRRTALAEQQQAGERKTESPRDETELEQPAIDLDALNQESLKLLNSAIVVGAILGLWFIWSDVLPAFGWLDHINLWHYTGTINGNEAQIAVTLGDVLLALLITAATIIAARRFPALLEIVLLKRVSVTAGGRYTATTLARYLIAGVGILLVLNTMGARWSQIQWMAAALSVGIGFGLQEIVANFISGLIILFERPIRVGDVVTVGDSDGIVTRIQIRATTIRTWDRQELLVPNKEFITGRLLNWSLSDQITRIRVPVGVAYGSDIAKAMALMRQVADHNKLVIDDPPASVIFNQFGDNTLNLELRCFVGNQDDRLPALSQLHQAINDVFNENGIVIAFPQRDVHLDTSRPLDVRIHRET